MTEYFKKLVRPGLIIHKTLCEKKVMTDTVQHLQNLIDYQFTDLALLRKALTHSSLGEAKNYERLEFLGDRVLGVVIAEMLFKTFPDEPEGDLAKRFAALVQGPMLAEIAAFIKLGDAMELSDAERAAGGGDNQNILADGLEALIGAVYLDGDLDHCHRIIKTLWGDRIHTMKTPPRDPKTALQEWAQARSLALPVYELIAQEGPDHAPVFEIKVTVEGYAPCIATGASRRKAEKKAATALLKKLEKQ